MKDLTKKLDEVTDFLIVMIIFIFITIWWIALALGFIYLIALAF